MSASSRGDGAYVYCGSDEVLLSCYGGAYSVDGSRTGLDGIFPAADGRGCMASGTSYDDQNYVIAACVKQ